MGQFNCNTSQLWKQLSYRPLGPAGQASLWLDNSALLQSTCTVFHIGLSAPCLSTLLCSGKTSWCFGQKNEDFTLHGKGKHALGSRGEVVYMDRNPCPWALIGPAHANVHFNPQFDMSNRHCLDWSEKSYSDWLDLQRLNAICWNRIPGNLYKDWVRRQKHSAVRKLVQCNAGSSLQRLLHKCNFHEKPLCRNGW